MNVGNFDQALADLSLDVGIPDFAQGYPEGMQLRFTENGARLGIGRQCGDVVVHYAETVRFDVAAALQAGMQKAARPEDCGHAVQVGLWNSADGDWIVAAIRFPEEQVDLRHIQERVAFLRQWLAEVLH